jgi:integrase/recombinase XerD
MIPIPDFTSFLVIKRRLAPLSVELVTGRVRIFEKTHTFTKLDVERFLYSLQEKGLKNNSINSYIFMLKEVYAYFQDRGIQTENFTEGMFVLDKNPRPIEILTPHEIEKIITATVLYGKFRNYPEEIVNENLNMLYRTFTRFLACTGARFSEAADLTVQYVDIEQGKVTFIDTKNKTHRFAFISPPLSTEIQSLIQGKKREERVFTNFLGSPVIPQNYGLHLRRACKTLGIVKRVHPHIFRHSFATQLLIEGVDVTMVASILGHKDIQTTYQNYVHLADETLRKSVYRHPLVRKNIAPQEIIRMIREVIDSLKLEHDNRFIFSVTQQQDSLGFSINAKKE